MSQSCLRSKHGGHGALLLPSVLLLLALSGGPLGSPWSLVSWRNDVCLCIHTRTPFFGPPSNHLSHNAKAEMVKHPRDHEPLVRRITEIEPSRAYAD